MTPKPAESAVDKAREEWERNRAAIVCDPVHETRDLAFIAALTARCEELELELAATEAERYRVNVQAEQAEAALAAAQVCGSCDHYDSFGSALYCTIECPERIHAYEHERYFAAECQFTPSRWQCVPLPHETTEHAARPAPEEELPADLKQAREEATR